MGFLNLSFPVVMWGLNLNKENIYLCYINEIRKMLIKETIQKGENHTATIWKEVKSPSAIH